MIFFPSDRKFENKKFRDRLPFPVENDCKGGQGRYRRLGHRIWRMPPKSLIPSTWPWLEAEMRKWVTPGFRVKGL